MKARAVAEIAPDLSVPLGMPAFGSGGGYDGPLAYRMGKPMRPDGAAAFRPHGGCGEGEGRPVPVDQQCVPMDAEPARLFAANPNPYLFSAL